MNLEGRPTLSRAKKKTKRNQQRNSSNSRAVGGTGRVLKQAFSAPGTRHITMAEREGAYCMFPEWPGVLAAGEATGRWPQNAPVLLRAPSVWHRDPDLDPDLPWFHNSSHIRRELGPADGRGNHGVGLDNLQRLPALLADPVAIWTSRVEGHSARRCAMLDARDDRGIPLVAVVDLLGVDDPLKIPCVHIVTIFGKNNFVQSLLAAAQGGDVVYIDLARFESILRRSPLANLVEESSARLAAFACVPATAPRTLSGKLAVRSIEELSSMRNSFDGKSPRVDMDALMSLMPKPVQITRPASEPKPVPDPRPARVATGPAAAPATEEVPPSETSPAPAPEAKPAPHAFATVPAPSRPSDADERAYLDEVAAIVERTRAYIDDWFYQHRYDCIDGDVDAFLNDAAGRVIAGLVSKDASPSEVVDAVVKAMLGR